MTEDAEDTRGAEEVARDVDRIAIKRAMQLANYYERPFLTWLLQRFLNSL